MEYRLLGPLEVRTGDAPLPLAGTKPRALLALLLLNANRVVTRDRLVDELWGDRPPGTAVATIQVYVSRLRKLLPEGTLVTHTSGYLLAVEPDTVDLQRFERLVNDARDAAPARTSELLREALALWRGPPLADFGDEGFARAEAARLTELRLAALEQRVEADLALGRHVDLVAELEALVGQHPHRERLHGQLMLSLYRAGRQAEALAAYRRTRAALDELGLEPTAALRRLERQILSQDPELDPEPQRLTDEAGAEKGETRPETPARRKTVTVVFCDLTNATLLGESRDPEATQLLMARCFERMTVIVKAHGGSAKWLTGDAVVAVFGVPMVHEDDAQRALRAAVELRDALPELGAEARLGVNTGEVVTSSGDALVTGEAVNVAARLQQAAGAGEILVGAETLALAGGAAGVEELEPLGLKGNAEPVAAFRLLALGELPERSHPSRFVGRSGELELLRDAWVRVVEGGRCELVTVVGEPGVGKSRLAAELVAGLDATVVTGRCLSYGEGIGYWPVLEVVKQLGTRPADAYAASVIETLMGESETATTPDEIAWAFRKLLEQEAPLLVLFDDLQWGEETFLDLVEQAGLLCAAPVLLLCLARPELDEHRPNWPLALRLEPLGQGDVERLLPASVPAGLRERIAHAAGGNPLFVTEMVAMAAGAEDELTVPPTLRALLAARLDQLESAERGVLESGAVEGEVFHRGAVQALGSSDASVGPRLAALVRRELIRPDRPLLPGEDGFRFCHLLVRDAAYEALPKATRAELHERFAGWLEQFSGDLVERDELVGVAGRPIGAVGDRLAEVEEIVGYHLEQAFLYQRELGALVDGRTELGERAARHLVGAAQRASALGNRDAVAGLLERALEIGITEPHERVRAQVELGTALRGTRLAESETVLTDAHDVAVSLGERGAAALALIRLSWKRTGDPSITWESREASCREAIETFTELGDEPGLADGRHLLAVSLTALGRLDEAQVEIERALEHAEAAGLPELLRETINTLLYGICVGPTPADEAIRRCEELFATARGDRLIDATVRRTLGLFYAMAGRRGEALESIQQSSLVLDEVRVFGVYRDVAAYALELAGDRDGAERELLTMWRHFRELGEGTFERRAWRAATCLAWLYCDEGRWEEAGEMHAYGRGVEGGFGMAVERSLAVEARLEARSGRLDQALALAERARARVDTMSGLVNQQAIVREALAEVLDTATEPARAEQARREAIALYEQKGNVASAARVRRGRPS